MSDLVSGGISVIAMAGNLLFGKSCGFCRSKTSSPNNFKERLIHNYNAFNRNTKDLERMEMVCEVCFRKNLYTKCSYSETEFQIKDDQRDSDQYKEALSRIIELNRLGVSFRIDTNAPISRLGLSLLIQDLGKKDKEISEAILNWRGISQDSVIQGLRLETTSLRIEATGATRKEAEMLMIKMAVVQGANGIINSSCSFIKNGITTSEVLGTGSRGNPYYGKKYEESISFTVSGIPVRVP